ncbi:MAG TPA: hypothetical protein VME20_03940 [Acidimicrobiales bacterium]|nr:hypothetical protein [Acidimicrobiales bacterium]
MPDNQHVAPSRSLKIVLTGVVAGGLALVLAACGGSPKSAVASLGNGTTTTAQPAPAATSGGGGGAGPASAGNPGSGGGERMVMAGANYTEMLKFSQCMRSHGLADFPDPSADGSISFGSADGINPQSPQFEAADKTCRKLLPNGGQPTPAQQAQFTAQALKFSQCMRAHGIADFPDPTSSGLEVSAKSGSDLDPNNPRFQAAQKACQSVMPGPKVAG